MSRESGVSGMAMRRYVAVALLLAMAGPVSAVAQRNPAQNQLSTPTEDAERIRRLAASGVRVERGLVTAWFSSNAMSPEEMQAVVERLVAGVVALEAFVRTPRRWQDSRLRNVTYFFDEAPFFVPHATVNRQVLVPVSRLRDGKAPLLHETTHVLLTPPQGRRPLAWLTEGIAAYVAKSVSAETRMAEGDALDIGAIGELDAKCAMGLSSELGPTILPFIGSPQSLQVLYAMEPALQVRQVFYGCSASFTKYLVQQLGIERIVDLLPENDPHKKLEELSKTKMTTVDPAVFDRYVGRYQLAPSVTITMTRDGNRFFTQLTGQPVLEIFAESETKFFLKVVDAQLTFEVDDQGRATAVVLHQNGRTPRAPRME